MRCDRRRDPCRRDHGRTLGHPVDRRSAGHRCRGCPRRPRRAVYRPRVRASRCGVDAGPKLHVERLAGPLDAVAPPGDDSALAAEPIRDEIADGIERRVVAAREDQRQVASSGDDIERDGGQPRQRLDPRSGDRRLYLRREDIREVGVAATTAANSRKNSRGDRAPLRRAVRDARSTPTAGCPRTRPKAGGSMTVSERTRSGTRAAESNEITPP